jgi:hypothetical protein
MSEKQNPDAAAQLRQAFDGMIEHLRAARDAIDTPELMPPPATQRNLAEGYRYLLGFLHGSIERALEDPHHPRFRRAIHPLNKSTIDNADAVYLRAAIDGERSYRIRGRAADSAHWRGGAPGEGRRAPQYVIFELASGYAGDSGSLAELRPGTRINTATLDSTTLQVDDDGGFDILLAPERPPGHVGNFLQTVRESRGVRHVGRHLTCRQLFHDWEREDLLDLEILMQGCEAEPAAPCDPARAREMLETVGALTDRQMRFWNAFYTVPLGAYGRVPGTIDTGSDAPFMPTNAMNRPNALGIATGGGQSTNLYAGGVYRLAADEALLVEATVPVEPLFLGVHLSNLWGESLDFESYQSSLNRVQTRVGADGVYRWVISHEDPGFANWLDTTGLEHGFVTFRASYAQPPEQALWPRVEARRVDLEELNDCLPDDAPRRGPKEREQDILMRHRHVQRRYRQY